MKHPQLSLRDLFWLVLVAACLCGWWVEHTKRLTARADLSKASQQQQESDRAFKTLLETREIKALLELRERSSQKTGGQGESP